MRARRGNGEGGFALIESVAVLALSAMVLLALLMAANLVTRNSAAAARRTNQIEELTTGIAALRRDIADIVDVRTNATEPPSVVFFGDQRSLGLAIQADPSDEDAGGSLVLVQSSYDNQGGSLVRTSGRLLPGTTGFADARLGNPVSLMSGPWTYRFAYAAASPAGLQWRNDWMGAPRLPAAIRLDIFHARQNQRVVPPLIVPLRVNAELACVPTEEEPCDEDGDGTGNGGGDPEDPQ